MLALEKLGATLRPTAFRNYPEVFAGSEDKDFQLKLLWASGVEEVLGKFFSEHLGLSVAGVGGVLVHFRGLVFVLRLELVEHLVYNF